MKRSFLLAATLLLGLSTTTAARAGGDADSAEPAPHAGEKPYRFHGDAIYAGAGAGLIADGHEATANARIFGTLSLADWAMIEGGFFGWHFRADNHHVPGETRGVVGLGIALGFRVAPSPDWPVRPYAAGRIVHVHMSPDPWAPHENADTHDFDDHVSLHRFGAALGAGLDIPLGGSRWRAGLDTEVLTLGGPGVDLAVQAVATIGYAL